MVKCLRIFLFALLFLPQSPTLSAQGFIHNIFREDTGTVYYHFGAAVDANGGMLTMGVDQVSPTGSARIVHYLNASGTWQWSVKLPQYNEMCLAAAQNGDFFVTGYNYLDQNIILTRLNNLGQVLWSFQYGNQYFDIPEELHELANGTIEILGSTDDTTGAGIWKPFRLQISSTGTLLQTDFATSIPAVNFYHFYYDNASGNYLAFANSTIALLDPSFNIVWLNEYTRPSGYFRLLAADFTSSANIVLGGEVVDVTGQKSILMTIDGNGNVLSSTEYLEGTYSRINALKALASGNIAVAGGATVLSKYTYNGQYRLKAFSFITDPSGQVVKAATFHQELASEAMSLDLKNDSTLLLSGSYSTSAIDDGFFFLKTDTALWSPVSCTFEENINENAVAITMIPYSTTFQTIQVNFGTQAYTPTVIPAAVPQVIVSCPTKTLLREQYDGEALWVAAAHDGNVVTAGYGMVPSHEALCLTKYTTEGDELWSYEYDCVTSSSNLPEYPGCVIETSDHGFMVAGGPDISASVVRGVFLMKVDSMGVPLGGSTRYTVSNQQSYIRRMQEDSGHNIIAMSGINVNSFSTMRMGLLKYDSLGHMLWSKTYTTAYSRPGDVISSYGNYFACGWRDTIAWIMKTDTAGNALWSKQIYLGGGINRFIHLFALAPASNDQFIAGGVIKTGASVSGKPIVFRFDTSGNIIWVKDLFITTGSQAEVMSITVFKGDRFLLNIFADDGSQSDARAYEVLMRGNGTIQWSTLYNYDAESGSLFNNSVLARDSAVILSASRLGGPGYHRFIKMTRFGQGPSCIANPISIPVYTTNGVIIQPAGLTAANLALTENLSWISRVADSLRCDYFCSIPDTSYYSSPWGGVGVAEPFVYSATGSNLILFPNPATNSIHLRSKQAGMKRIDIFGNTGQLVISIENKYSESDNDINLEGLPGGCYFVRVVMENNTVENLRCIKLE